MYDIFLPSPYPSLNFFLNHANINIMNCCVCVYIHSFQEISVLGNH